MRALVVMSSLLAVCAADAGIIGLGGAPLLAGAYGAAPLIGGRIAAAPYAARGYAAAALPVAAVAPRPYVAAPAVVAPVSVETYAAPAPAVPSVTSSQYNSADEFGNIAYGYNNINSAKQESGVAGQGVTGSYSYTDEAGLHTINYVADAYGFRATTGGARLVRRQAPAREAILTTIKLNPGHAIFYRVD